MTNDKNTKYDEINVGGTLEASDDEDEVQSSL